MRAFVLLSLIAALPASAGSLQLEVRARALEPGELLRVEASAEAEDLASVEGTLHGESLEFVREADGRAWSAWAVLDLDWEPGDVPLRVSARTAGGAALEGERAIRLAAKKFPVSELKVEGKYVNPPKSVQARIEREKALLAEVYARRTPLAPPEVEFVRPVPGEPTSVFGARRVFNGEKRAPHPGLDLRAATGTPVKCTGPGVVALSRDLYFSGNTVIVDHGGGLFTVYAHLSRLDAREGAQVQPGDLLGLSGATGRVTGPHLHWGGKVGKRIFDPTSLLDPAVLPGVPKG